MESKNTVLLKIEIDNVGSLKSIKDLEAALKEQNKALKGADIGSLEYKKLENNVKILKAELKGLTDATKANTNALGGVNQSAKFAAGSYGELRQNIKTAKDELQKYAVGSEEFNKTEATLIKLLDEEIAIREKQPSLFKERIKQGIQEAEVTKSIKQQYAELIAKLSSGELKQGTKEFQEVAAQAGKLKDQINDAKQATKELATGSKLEAFKNSLGGVGESLKNLDFEEAALKAKGLKDVAASINFKDVAAGAKDAGKALVDLGKSILLNPFFLFAGVVVAAGVALKQYYDETVASGIRQQERLNNALQNEVDYRSDIVKVIEKNSKNAEALATAQGKKDTEIVDLKIANKERENKALVLLEQDLVNQINKLNKTNTTDEELLKKEQKQIEEAEQLRKETKEKIKQNLVDINIIRTQFSTTESERIKKEREDYLKEQDADLQRRIKLAEDGEKEFKKLRDDALAQAQKENELTSRKKTLEQKELLAQGLITEEQYEVAVNKIQTDSLNTQLQNLINSGDNSLEAQTDIAEKELEIKEKKAEDDLKIRKQNQADNEAIDKEELEAAQYASMRFAEMDREQLALEQSILQVRLSLAETFVKGTQGLLLKDAENRAKYGKVLKALAIAEIGINLSKELSAIAANSAANPTNALTFGIAGATQYTIQSIIAIARSAFAVAQVTTQKLEQGGGVKAINIDGKRHSEGGEDVIVGGKRVANIEGGENMYILKRSASDYVNKLSHINQAFGGNSFGGTPVTRAADGGFIQTRSSDRVNQQMTAIDLANAIKSMPTPVVRVSEINSVQGNLKTAIAVSTL